MTNKITKVYIQHTENNGKGLWKTATESNEAIYDKDNRRLLEVSKYTVFSERRFNDIPMYRPIDDATCEVEEFRHDEQPEGWIKISKRTDIEHTGKIAAFITADK